MRKLSLLMSMVFCLLVLSPVLACHDPLPPPPPSTHVYYTLTIWAMSCNGKPNFGHVDTNISASATTITVLAGTSITVNAHANPGWMFEAFYIDNVQIFGHDYSVTIKMTENITLRVQFNPYPTYTPKPADPAPDPPAPTPPVPAQQPLPSSPEHIPTPRWGTHPTPL